MYPLRFPNFLEEQICCSNRVTLTEIWTPLTGADFLPFRFVTWPTKNSKAVLPCVVFPSNSSEDQWQNCRSHHFKHRINSRRTRIKVQTLSEIHVSHSWVSTHYFIVVMMTKILHTHKQRRQPFIFACLAWETAETAALQNNTSRLDLTGARALVVVTGARTHSWSPVKP